MSDFAKVGPLTTEPDLATIQTKVSVPIACLGTTSAGNDVWYVAGHGITQAELEAAVTGTPAADVPVDQVQALTATVNALVDQLSAAKLVDPATIPDLPIDTPASPAPDPANP